MMGTKITVLEASLGTQDMSSIRLPTQGVMYPQRCFRYNLIYNFCTCVIVCTAIYVTFTNTVTDVQYEVAICINWTMELLF